MRLIYILGLFTYMTFCSGISVSIYENEQFGSQFNELLASVERLKQSHDELKEELRVLRKANPIPEPENKVTVGGNYVRWGRTECPENVETLYRGYAAGSWYAHSGAASNYLCLPERPEWSNKTRNDSKLNSVGAEVHGAEYELTGSDANVNFFGVNIHDRNVPCAVCDTPRSSIIMIPGKITCYHGWTVEYVGYLTAGHKGHAAASEYVCLDESPEVVAGRTENENGALFYLTEARCTSLPCPPVRWRKSFVLYCLL